MALVDFERWLDDKIDFFKKRGTVIFGNEQQGEGSSDSDEYGEFEMAHEEQNYRRKTENPEEFSLSEPEYEFDDSELKGSEYYRFVFNELEDDDEDELFDRASHVSLPKSGVPDDIATYQDLEQDLEFSDDPDVRNSYDAVQLAQQGADQLKSLGYSDQKRQTSHYRDADYRFDGDGESFPGSLTQLEQVETNDNQDLADYALAQVSDENAEDSRYHRKSLKFHEMSTRATLPMDSTYLSMDESELDEDMLEDVRFDDYEGTEVPPDTRPIMVTEQTLREMYEKKRKLLKQLALCFAILFGITLTAVIIYLIFKFSGRR